MAQYAIDEIKRLSTCPILHQNRWDYEDKPALLPSYLYGMSEAIRWYYRRGRQISPDTITTSVSHHAFQSKLDLSVKINLEDAIRRFTSGGFYQGMEQPFYQKEVQIFLNDKGDVLTHKIPCLVKRESTVYFLTYDLGEIDREIFINSYETMFQSVWSFYVLDKVPIFINLYFDGKNILEQRVKVNLQYIKESKKRIISLGRNFKRDSPPPSEICRHCDRRQECQMMTRTDQLLKK